MSPAKRKRWHEPADAPLYTKLKPAKNYVIQAAAADQIYIHGQEATAHDEQDNHPARISEAEKAYQFILGGNATFTLRSQETGTRYTYKVTLAEKRPGDKEDEWQKWFVALLSGPDNQNDFTYLGMIRANQFQLTRASRMKLDSLPVKAFHWTFANLVQHRFPDKLEIWHEGRCGRCGRKLTVPESIATGFGPECAGIIGGGL